MKPAKPAARAVRLNVRAKPRARRSRVLRANGLSIEVCLAAPPVDGAANAELLLVLASALGVPRSHFRIALGAAAKIKVVEVEGLDEVEVADRLAQAADRR